MEESGSLMPKALASRPPSHDGKPSKNREEGEVTSSDEDALPACSSAPSMSNSDSVFPSKSSNFGGKSSLQGVKSGKSIFANQSGSADIQSRTSLQIGTLKGFAKQKGSFKSSNSQWHKPNGGNSNLVISFSDDDSGSDNEQQEPRKECEIDGSSHALDVVTRSKQPSPLPPVKDTIRKTISNEGKMLPKKLTMNQALAPRSNIPKPRNIWPSVEQRSRSTNSNIVTRNFTIRGSGRSKSVDLSGNKLQDLRQQIAMRENELKLKTIQQSKENLSEPCRGFNNINQSNPAPRRSRDLSSDVHLDVKEPDAKRKKPSQGGSDQPSKGFNEKVSAKHLFPSKGLVAECNNFQDSRLIDREHHDGQIAQRESSQDSTRMQMPDQQFSTLLANPNATEQNGPGLSVSCSLSDWMSKSRSNLLVSSPKPSVADISLLNLPKTASVERAKQLGAVNGTGPSSSGMRATPVDDTNKCKYQQDVQGKANRFKYDSNAQGQAFQTPPNGASTSNHRHRVNNQGFDDTDIRSLFAIEEFHDKQLEEAQEHRHRCEIEERNALKVYLKAQRALAEANAQCTYLYRKRELFSARLCSLLTDNPSLMLPSQQQEHFGDLWNFSNNVSEVNLDLIPPASDQMHAELDGGNQVGYESNVQSADGDVHKRFSPNVDGNNLGSETCSEPDASTSELLPHTNKETPNGVLSPSNDLNVSSDECEEMYAIQGKKGNIGDLATVPVDSSQESVRLEAYLRSKLFSRLETLASSRRNGVGGKRDEGIEQLPDADTRNDTEMTLYNISPPQPEKQVCEHGTASGDQQEASAEGRTKDDEGSAEAQLTMNNGLHSDITEKQSPDLGGFEAAVQSLSTFQEVKEHSLDNSADRNHRTANSKYSRPWPTDVNQCLSMSTIFRSAFYQLKGEYSASFNDVYISTEQDGICCPVDNRRVDCTEESVGDSLVRVIDSYSRNSLIDPLWPLCMHELRGRCNNEECPWQHVRDHTKSNLQHKSPSSADSVTGTSSNCSNQKVGEPSHVLAPPAYLVCVDSLKPDPHTHSYILDRQCGPSWRKIFSLSLVAPSFLQRHGCTEIHGNPNRQSLFQSRNDTMSLFQTDLPENYQVLETALLILNQEIDKAVGTRKSLALLSRGLEADPASLHLWVVYLLIYYSDRDSVGDDELFSCAVKSNKGSYELWLMYIKNCGQLQGQLLMYDRALSSLCRYAHDFNGDTMHASACILDLFLQMLHCFCMSGNVETIVERIHRLADDVKDADCVLLFDILHCLEVSDKCVFWVSCAYLLIYKKLPDVIVGMFEFEKDISLIDWPFVHKTTEEKQVVHKLMEAAADYMQSHVDSVCPENNTALRAAQLFALNHVKLMAAIDNFESCKDILEKYSNQYSSCLEVALLAARVHSQKCEGNNFLGFEDAVSNWPKEVPGIQCIWNQFAEHAFQNGGCHVGIEIMLRWSKAQSLQNNRADHVELFSWDDASESKLGSMDTIFGLLNLSLYELLQNDVEKAYLAVDKAMKSAHQDFRHCIKEHATFMLNYRFQMGKDVSLAGLLDILKSYIFHTHNSPVSEPLTRKFIQQISKPRLRQLVHGIISPISPDFSTVNLVLETWFGSSLLPQNFNKVKELVDFVEAVLDLSPQNYPLAISTCKLLLSKEIGSSASTLFWASSLLVNTIYQSVPVPPEYVWVEAAGLLTQLTGIEATVSESFHQRALSVYPFSMNLWKSFLKQSVSDDSRRRVVDAAKEKGIELPLTLLEEKGLEATKEKGS